MNTLAEHWQLPMATYGPGDSSLDHADDEHVPVADFLAAIDVLTDALNRLGGELGGDRQPAGNLLAAATGGDR
jgi:LysW-gamma-L-lysine carboxypeptidase